MTFPAADEQLRGSFAGKEYTFNVLSVGEFTVQFEGRRVYRDSQPSPYKSSTYLMPLAGLEWIECGPYQNGLTEEQLYEGNKELLRRWR